MRGNATYFDFYVFRSSFSYYAGKLLADVFDYLFIELVAAAFYGFGNNNFTEENTEDAISLHSGSIQTESVR